MAETSARKELGQRLRVAREQAGLSQGQVAAKLGMHRPTVTEIEAGNRKVSAEELTSFAELYDVGLAWLARGSKDVADPAVELAARELAKLKKEDLDTVLHLLRTLKRTGEKA